MSLSGPKNPGKSFHGFGTCPWTFLRTLGVDCLARFSSVCGPAWGTFCPSPGFAKPGEALSWIWGLPSDVFLNLWGGLFSTLNASWAFCGTADIATQDGVPRRPNSAPRRHGQLSFFGALWKCCRRLVPVGVGFAKPSVTSSLRQVNSIWCRLCQSKCC